MKAKNFIEAQLDGVFFEMVFVEGGHFMMGSEDEEAYQREKPIHEVLISGFYIGKFPVTQELWSAVLGGENNPSVFKGHNRPVESISWENAEGFVEKLKKSTGKPYRFLSESEWEYAARGGKHGQGFKFAGNDKLNKVAWFRENSYGETKPVGLKLPNELGIYDMSGNVYEWVEDQNRNTYKDAPNDGTAWLGLDPNSQRVLRGGAWSSRQDRCRIGHRSSDHPSYRDYSTGFRLGLSITQA